MEIDVQKTIEELSNQEQWQRLAYALNYEVEKGYKLISFGEYSWFKAEEWEDFTILSQKDNKVRICWIATKKPGNSCFSRLVKNIIKDGFNVNVVGALGDMELILKRWGWKQKLIGDNFYNQENIWKPTKAWKNKIIKE